MTAPDTTSDTEKQASGIYEQICATSGDRPSSGNNLHQMQRDIANWQANNPGLLAIRQASAQVLLSFLNNSAGWIQAETKQRGHFRTTQTLCDAIVFTLNSAPKPLPSEIVLHLLASLCKSPTTHHYYPLELFLSVITREQVNDEIRAELRKLHLQYAPSPTGKIENPALALRNRIAELMRAEDEKQIDPGRGPWSQIVFDELAVHDPITRAGWQGLLEHCRALEPTVPGAKWNQRARELITALGEKEVIGTFTRWLSLGPTPGQPAEARSPIEDSAYQKGVVWCLAHSHDPAAVIVIANFGSACLRKVRMLGAVSQKVGFACVQALGTMPNREAIAQLSRLRLTVKYSVARRLIERSLRQAAEQSGITTEDLEDSCVDGYALDSASNAEISIADARAIVRLMPDGRVAVSWHNAEGKLVKSAPSHIKKAFAKEVKSVTAFAKALEQTYSAQCARLEASFASPRTMPLAHWRKCFIDHPVLGLLGRRLIWVFHNADGWEASGLWVPEESPSEEILSHESKHRNTQPGNVRDVSGKIIDLARAQTVSLWHPLSSTADELQRWRDRVFTLPVHQPFRQAFREFYQVTDEERKTPMHSNRFAGVLMRQHQLASLCRARGWDYRLMGDGFDGFNVPKRSLPQWNMHAEFCVDLPSDRDATLRESALGEQSGSGINLFIASDQVRFYRDRKEITLDDVPAIVYSEVMRDIDLFTSVCAIGADQSWAGQGWADPGWARRGWARRGWANQGDRGCGILSACRGAKEDLAEFNSIIALRAEMLTRVLPHTAIADRAHIEKSWLNVRGQLGTYRIQLAWGTAMLCTESGPRCLQIPQKLLDSVSLGFAAIPIDLDYRTETILRQAHVLADDWKIDSADVIRQLMAE
jgi:hypothetical protein